MTNRLAGATSPYLLQHAENPVDWWEWGPEAFEEARRRNVPVLLSVGYAACHWCHVMAHESFEDEATAAYMNEHFVSIKVDREERPDVDAVYMQATVSMTGHGGWPMTCVLDHDGNPFFAGTYYPPEPRHGQASFTQVLEALSDAWSDRADEVHRVAASLREHLQAPSALPTAPIDATALQKAVVTLAGEFDPMAGGFGAAPKFPPTMVLELLRRFAARDVEEGSEEAQVVKQARHMLARTVQAMAGGGMYDQLGGGFARYAVDRGWVVPHFEKMLYDNGQLLGLYARLGTSLGDRVARETADFMLRELRTPEGGFASALDADSEGAEGTFYVWTPAQLVEVLGADDGAWAADVLAVTEEGTFEHGTSTLQLRHAPDDADRWDGVRRRLLAARDERVRPARDDKVVAAWNGLAISGLADAWRRLGEQRWLDAALDAGRLLVDVHLVDGRLRRVSRDGVVGAPAGVLEDLGCVATAFVDLAAATADATWLDRARALMADALARFRAGDGGFHDTAADAEALVARPRDPGDNASPSGTSASVHAFVGLAALTGEREWDDAAREVLATVGGLASKAPRFAGWSLAAAEAMLDGPSEIAVVGRRGPERDALALAAYGVPGAVVVVAEPGESAIPLLQGRVEVGGRPAAYVCRHHVCAAPVTDPAQVGG
jgi:uncharacterized protein YyaL (SSP411 family)